MRTSASSLLAEVPDIPGHETRRLLIAAVGGSPSWLVGDPQVSKGDSEEFWRLVERRRGGEPLQYIEGTVAFGPLELLIDRRALIPRPETEQLWELAVATLRPLSTTTVVDLCTGSGNIALALKKAVPQARVIGTDVSLRALSLAKENATSLDLDVELLHGDLFEALPRQLVGAVDLVVSNPPYVAAPDLDELPAEVRDYEPHSALFADADGLAVLRRIASEVDTWLKPGGVLISEIGESQGAACIDLFGELEPEILPDLAGRDRFVVGRSPMRPELH